MLSLAAVGMVLVNFLAWGHWPICAKMANAESQAFGVVMVAVQTLLAWALCITTGGSVFVAEALSVNPLAALSVITGGAALAIGDFAAAAAIGCIGVAVGGPVTFSMMLIGGTTLDYFLEGNVVAASAAAAAVVAAAAAVVVTRRWQQQQQH